MRPWTLANGLSVYFLPSDTPFTAVVLGYKVGAAYDPSYAPGTAHLLEHLLFEDEDIRYDQKIQSVGGSTNAYTGQDYTVYYARVPKDQVKLALELEAARLFDLKLTPEKIAIQRQVVAEEFRQRYLNPPYADRFFHLTRMAFPDHPYGTMVIGESPEQVLTLPEEALRSFYERFYIPPNAVLCVAGGGIEEDLSAYIRLLYERQKEGELAPTVPSADTVPIRESLTVRKGAFPQVAVFWAYRLPPLAAPTTQAMDLLDDFLGESRSGFLTKRLVYDKGLASRLSSFVWSMHQGGLWVVEAYLSPRVSVETYEAELEKAMQDLLQADLTEALSLYRPLRYLALHREREKALGRASALVHAVLAGHPEWYEDPLTPYEALSVGDLQEVIERFLTPDRRVRLHYLPEK
ncbi:MAG: insulinase family protein [Bacteroidia bacterium]|nr:insulinase family protein [Bacteroidia bacterium]